VPLFFVRGFWHLLSLPIMVMCNFCGWMSPMIPMFGQLHFLTRWDLVKKMLIPFFAMSMLTAVLLVVLPMFAWQPQVNFLKNRGWNSTICDILGVIIIPAEVGLGSYIIFTLAFGAVTSEIKMAALIDRGVDKKIMERYNLDSLPSTTKIQDVITNFQFLYLQLILMVATFPLNIAPGVGQAGWIMANGWAVTWEGQTDLLPMIGYGSKFNQIVHMFKHPISHMGFGFTSFAICLIPLANIAWAGGIAYGSGMLFEEFVNEGVQGPDPLPVPGWVENAVSGVGNAVGGVANAVGSGFNNVKGNNVRSGSNVE